MTWLKDAETVVSGLSQVGLVRLPRQSPRDLDLQDWKISVMRLNVLISGIFATKMFLIFCGASVLGSFDFPFIISRYHEIVIKT